MEYFWALTGAFYRFIDLIRHSYEPLKWHHGVSPRPWDFQLGGRELWDGLAKATFTASVAVGGAEAALYDTDERVRIRTLSSIYSRVYTKITRLGAPLSV